MNELDGAFASLLARAKLRDASDDLAPFRERFLLPESLIYLDGNSLGAVCRDADESLRKTSDSWRDRQIGGWTDGDEPWLFLPEHLGARVAKLVGASPESVIATGSTTSNLHQLLATLFAPTPDRQTILLDSLAFPSDRYAVRSHLRLRGLDPEMSLKTVVSRDNLTLATSDILDALADPQVALAVLPSVVFTSGQLLDMATISKAARANGVMILWDLSHSVGAVAHELDGIGADAAFWCHYKWCNAGPGAVGGLYLNARHFGKSPGIAGWFGAKKESLFGAFDDLPAAADASAMQIGTTHLFSLAPLAGALNLFDEATLPRLREKSLALTRFLAGAIDEFLAPLGATIATPRQDSERGGHIALRHPTAAALCKSLRAKNIVPDHRPPDLIRIAPAPLYNTFEQIAITIKTIHEILTAGLTPDTTTPKTDLVP